MMSARADAFLAVAGLVSAVLFVDVVMRIIIAV